MDKPPSRKRATEDKPCVDCGEFDTVTSRQNSGMNQHVTEMVVAG